MPIRWTSDNDQVLLLTIINSHNFSINYDTVAEHWPKDRGEIPTARAIRERIVKLRNTSGVRGTRSTGSAASTPRAPRTTGTPQRTPGSKASTAKKRKRTDDSDDDDEEFPSTVPKRELQDLQNSPSAGRGGRTTTGTPLRHSAFQGNGHTLGSSDGDAALASGGPVSLTNGGDSGRGMFARTPVAAPQTHADDGDDDTGSAISGCRSTPRRAASAGVARAIKAEDSDSQAESDMSEYQDQLEI
ncbi:uncharacterized protein K452DRAFT_307694 [Aplosporella prunicola CBS 121167]|uniref:Uncharacterized protein n=1 Tax=Aplosporella prunicola CBS 121167 TaxID=1176127 RepID=A0A6A6BF34_9PEZI|nr:uncharacterized protein K452DRAFT_307694 [Aplosporella prunicola CBS 121167]KAF2142772.1 hypothetical protein K452DRAFT_307694 [Aplosporella prunicola CBS 121167]